MYELFNIVFANGSYGIQHSASGAVTVIVDFSLFQNLKWKAQCFVNDLLRTEAFADHGAHLAYTRQPVFQVVYDLFTGTGERVDHKAAACLSRVVCFNIDAEGYGGRNLL